MRERPFAVDGEPAVDRAHALDALQAEAPLPAGALAHRVRVREELVARSGGSGSRAVRSSGAGEPRRSASRTASPGNDAGARCPSLSERMRCCRIDAARVRHTSVGSLVRPEDDDLVRAQPAVPQRRVRRERREPATDDRAAHGAIEGTSHATRGVATAARPTSSTHGSYHSGCSRWPCDCSGRSPFGSACASIQARHARASSLRPWST